jgi:tetratricopeptide (TPR) repeat protein
MKRSPGWLVGSMLLALGLAGTAQAKYLDAPALIRQGNSFFSNGQYEEAARAYKQALKVEASADAAYNLALTYHHRLNYYAKALHYYQQFLQMEPNAPEARQVKSWLSEVRYQVFPEEGQKDPRFKRPSAQDLIVEAEPDDLDTQKGNEFLRQKNYRQAIQAYERALGQKNSQVACLNLALLYDFELGYLQKAIFYYQRFLALAAHKPQEKVAIWLAKAEATLRRKKGHFYQGTAFQLRQP